MPPESQPDADPLSVQVGTPEYKAVAAIFETWNTSLTRARAAIKLQTDGFRNRKGQVPPVVHYAGALVLMQIGANAAPDVENLHLAKLGDHPLATLARSRISIREDDYVRAEELASNAIGDKRTGVLGEAMKEAAVALSAPDAVESKEKKKSVKTTVASQVASQVVKLIADAKAKSDEDLDDERREMKLLDARYKASGEELVRLNRDLNWIQNQSVGFFNGFRGYYSTPLEKSIAYSQTQQRITAVENERRQAVVRHANLKKFEANEVAKLGWRIWSANLPWSVEEERKRLLAGKTAAEYYSAKWEYKPSLPTELPKQIPPPYKPNRKKK